MSRWILDTDHVTLLLMGDPNVIKQAAERHPNVAVTIITVQELFNGWVGRLNRNSEPDRLVELYAKLSKTLRFIKAIKVLDFDQATKEHYFQLRQQNKDLTRRRIEKDVRIAAIALSQNATLVTRNQKDFSQVPRLQIDNWATPPKDQ